MQLGLEKSPAAFRQHTLYIIFIFSFIRKIFFYINRYINHPPTLYLYQRSISRVIHPLPLINLRNSFYSKIPVLWIPLPLSPFVAKDPLFKKNIRHSLIPDIFFFPSLCHSSGSLGNRLNNPVLFSTLPSVIFLQQLVPSAIILMSSSLKNSA